MLKAAQDESSHLMQEIGNVADSTRRTAVKLRGRETGAWLAAGCAKLRSASVCWQWTAESSLCVLPAERP